MNHVSVSPTDGKGQRKTLTTLVSRANAHMVHMG